MAGVAAPVAAVVAGFPAWRANMKNPCALLVVFLLPVLSPDLSYAVEWKDVWQTPDQQAEMLLKQEQSEQAAARFEDPEWKASALYRAEKYKESAEALDGIESADASYNRGNALAKSGDLKAALAAYEQALKMDKAHEDARFNRDLVKKAMQKQQSKQQQSKDQDKSEKSDKSDKAEQQSGEKKQEDQGDKSKQNSGQQSSEQEKNQSGKQSGQNEKEDNQSSESQQSEQQQQKEEKQSQSEQQKQAEADAEKEKERQQQAMQSSENKEQEKAEAKKEMKASAMEQEADKEQTEEEKAQQQWLRRIPDDPGGLLRRKFRYQYRQRAGQAAGREGQAW